jgi:hypothetical protein
MRLQLIWAVRSKINESSPLSKKISLQSQREETQPRPSLTATWQTLPSLLPRTNINFQPSLVKSNRPDTFRIPTPIQWSVGPTTLELRLQWSIVYEWTWSIKVACISDLISSVLLLPARVRLFCQKKKEGFGWVGRPRPLRFQSPNTDGPHVSRSRI